MTHEMNPESELCRSVQSDPRGETWSDLERAHAAACPACTAYLEGCEALADRLKGHPFGRERMPAALRNRLVRELQDASAPGATPSAGDAWYRRPAIRQVLVPVAMAASLVLGIGLEKAFEFGGPGALPVEVRKDIGLYIDDVTHDHYLLERIGRPLEVAITDAGDLSSWLSSSLNFDFQLPGDSGSLALQGGRVWHTVGRLSALASYETEAGDRIVLFAVPAENMDLGGARSSMIGGVRVFEGRGWDHEARVWIEGDLALALTAPEGHLPEDWAGIFLP